MDARLVFVVSISPPLVRPTRRLSRTYLHLHTAYRLAFLATRFARLIGEARP